MERARLSRTPLAVFEAGLDDGAAHTAHDAVQRAASRTTAWLRFHRYRPCASLGRHEVAGHAVRAGWCSEQGIGVVRRESGGTAVFLDPDQLCLTLTFPRPPGGAALAWLPGLARAVAASLARLGLGARYAPPHEIEVAGRRLAFVFLDAGRASVLFHAFLHLRADVETHLRALRMPLEKLSPRGMQTARDRIATLDGSGIRREDAITALADGLKALGFAPAPVSPPEWLHRTVGRSLPVRADEDWSHELDAWQHGFITVPGGVLHARARQDAASGRIARLELAGSAHVHPSNAFSALSASLRGATLESLDERIARACARTKYEFLGFTAADLGRLIRRALWRQREEAAFALDRRAANTLMVHGSLSAGQVVAVAGALLVPYCAKPTWCKWRHRDGCPECGRCEAGEAYRLARALGLRVHTITSYEHLRETLARLAGDGVRAYVGMCCHHFYIKRARAFEEAGMPALLLDIGGSNCYELRQEEAAYAGRFAAQARIDVAVLRNVLAARR